MNKKGETKSMWEIALIIGILAIVLQNFGFLGGAGGVITSSGGLPVIQAPRPTTQLAADGVCPVGGVIEDSTITFDWKDKFTATDTTNGNVYISVDGGSPYNTTAGDGGTKVLNPGQKVDVWFAFDSPNYYSEKKTFSVPCEGSPSPWQADLYKNGTITFKLTSQDDDTALGGTCTNIESITAGQNIVLSGSVVVETDRGFPHGGVWVVSAPFNSTGLKKDRLDITLDGTKLTKVIVPDIHPNAAVNALTAADVDEIAFEVPANLLVTNREIPYTITFELNSPGSIGGPLFNNTNFTFYDYDYYVADDGSIKLGAEDDNNANVGSDSVLNTKFGFCFNSL